jgi:hypothetical protein
MKAALGLPAAVPAAHRVLRSVDQALGRKGHSARARILPESLTPLHMKFLQKQR